MNRRRLKLIFAVLIITVLIGCTAVPQTTELMEEADGLSEVTSREIGIRLTEFAYIFSGSVEYAADEIIKRTEDQQIKRNALAWKIYSIPAAHKAMFVSDPFAGFIDTWALCVQIRDYLTVGSGKTLFGEHQWIAEREARFLEEEILKVGAFVLKRDSLEAGIVKMDLWASENPLNNIYFLRRSTIELYANIIGSEQFDIGSSVGSIAENVEALKNMTNMYAGFLPKHAKWHAKLLMMDLSLDYISDSLSADLGGISGSLGRIAEFTDELQLRLDSLIIESFFEVNRQRIETLMVLREEIQSIRELISSERRALLAEVNRQRLETVEEVKSISISTLNGASDVIKDAIDHLIIRVVQMLLIVFLIALLIYYLYPRLKRKRLNQ